MAVKHTGPQCIRMLTELYIEALLVDEELADLVWELSEAGLISDDLAAIAWWQVSYNFDTDRPKETSRRASRKG